MAALRERVTLALRFAQANASVPAETANELSEFTRLLTAVGAEMPQVHAIAMKLRAFTLLARNRGNHSVPAAVDEALSQIAGELEALTGGIQERFKAFAYPFPHARGALTVAEYARCEKPADNDLHRVYLNSDAHVDRLFALHYRLVGRVLAHAAVGEKMLSSPTSQATH